MDRLRRNGFRGSLPRNVVGLCGGGAIEANPIRRTRREKMKLAIRLLDFIHRLKVHRRNAIDRNGATAGPSGGLMNIASQSADHALCRCVHDQQSGVMKTNQRLTHDFDRFRNDRGAPLRSGIRRQSPCAADRVAWPGKLRLEERRSTHPAKHFIAIGPRTKREEADRLAEAVADRCTGAQTDELKNVAGQHAEGNLSKDEPLDIMGDRAHRLLPPAIVPIAAPRHQLLRRELTGEPIRLSIERIGHLREVQGELTPHTEVVIAGTGEYKCEVTRTAERIGKKENAILTANSLGRLIT